MTVIPITDNYTDQFNIKITAIIFAAAVYLLQLFVIILYIINITAKKFLNKPGFLPPISRRTRKET
jgi:hypothetical protein